MMTKVRKGGEGGLRKVKLLDAQGKTGVKWEDRT